MNELITSLLANYFVVFTHMLALLAGLSPMIVSAVFGRMKKKREREKLQVDLNKHEEDAFFGPPNVTSSELKNYNERIERYNGPTLKTSSRKARFLRRIKWSDTASERASKAVFRVEDRRAERPSILELERVQIEKNIVLGKVDTEAGKYVRLYYGTNRNSIVSDELVIGYNRFRNSNGTVHLGICNVFVPKAHKIGSLGSSAIRIFFSGTDDRLKVIDICELAVDGFWSAIHQELQIRATKNSALIFIHGYNVSFNNAALRAAQISADLGVGGITAFFSWASSGRVIDYFRDEASVEVSEGPVRKFIENFLNDAKIEEINIVVHSMGNRAIVRSIERIASDYQGNKKIKQIILAAADIDAQMFASVSKKFVAAAERTTIYSSRTDIAVMCSRFIHGYDRLGFHPPVQVFEGIDTVSATNVNLKLLGHGYIAEARPVLADIHSLILNGLPPEMRFGLEQVENLKGQSYWKFKG